MGQYKNATKHDYRRIDGYGKSLIELTLSDHAADAFLIIFPKKSVMVNNNTQLHMSLDTTAISIAMSTILIASMARDKFSSR
jgi:hypothetical protein